MVFIFDILIWRIIYSFTKFRKLPEDGWNEIGNIEINPEQKNHKHWKIGRAVKIIIISLMFLFILFNLYSFAYLRYMTESLIGGNPGTAQAMIIFHNENINLNETDTRIKMISADDIKYFNIEVNTDRIPKEESVYLNGKDVTGDIDVDYIQWYFWESDYFKKDMLLYVNVEIHTGTNTLEVKSDNFDKKWIFTLEKG